MSDWKKWWVEDGREHSNIWSGRLGDDAIIVVPYVPNSVVYAIVRDHNAMPKMREALKAVYHDDPSERISLETRAKVLAALEASNA